MFLTEMICSDEECELMVEAAGDLRGLEVLVCEDRGCCLQVVSLSAWEPVRPRARLELPRAA